MNIFDQYGIKEVADVTLYSIHKKENGSGDVYYVPALYLDTLKISSVEKTAENVWAQGGLGNSRLICWDYGKQINVTLEDALCSPASLGMCWGGVLGADWKDAHIEQDFGISFNDKKPVERISRMEKAFYPRSNSKKGTISYLLPHTEEDKIDKDLGILLNSQVVDGTNICGHGMVRNHSYAWTMYLESDIQSIAVVPHRFFDVYGNSYPIDLTSQLIVNSNLRQNDKFNIIYKINSVDSHLRAPIGDLIVDASFTKNFPNFTPSKQEINRENDEVLINYNMNQTKFIPPTEEDSKLAIKDAEYLCIYIDNDNNYTAYLYGGKEIIPNDDSITQINQLAAAISNNEIKTIINKISEAAQNLIEEEISYSEYSLIMNDQVNLLNIYFNANPESNSVTIGDNTTIITDYLKNIFHEAAAWHKSEIPIDVEQFKNIDMWLRFSSINEMIYFLLTKYEDDIAKIGVAQIGEVDEDEAHPQKEKLKDIKNENKLWAYINPKTMTPYPDDYWFHQGEPYYIKSLTLAPEGKKLKSQHITITAGQFPGMYMLVGETYIRSRDTGGDERMQIKIPLCKVKSNQTITLQADGEPTVFSMEVEVARPTSGIMMELTAYEIAEKMELNEQGFIESKDGSTEVLSE